MKNRENGRKYEKISRKTQTFIQSGEIMGNWQLFWGLLQPPLRFGLRLIIEDRYGIFLFDCYLNWWTAVSWTIMPLVLFWYEDNPTTSSTSLGQALATYSGVKLFLLGLYSLPCLSHGETYQTAICEVSYFSWY